MLPLCILEIMTVRHALCAYDLIYNFICSGVTATLSVPDSNVNEGKRCKVIVSLNQTANTKMGFMISSITMTATGIKIVLHLLSRYKIYFLHSNQKKCTHNFASIYSFNL